MPLTLGTSYYFGLAKTGEGMPEYGGARGYYVLSLLPHKFHSSTRHQSLQQATFVLQIRGARNTSSSYTHQLDSKSLDYMLCVSLGCSNFALSAKEVSLKLASHARPNHNPQQSDRLCVGLRILKIASIYSILPENLFTMRRRVTTSNSPRANPR